MPEPASRLDNLLRRKGLARAPRPKERKEKYVGFAENRGGYWRGRYKIAPGEYGTVKDDRGETIRFRTKREAEQAANAAEAAVRAGTWNDPALGRITFGKYASDWYASQDLAASTMQNYRNHIEGHLLPTFEHVAVADITEADVKAWERARRAAGYAESSISSWRATLHLILSDAVAEGLRASNPAAKRRGRGRRVGRASSRGPEKAVTTALGLLLIAERMALLSGRDAEFVAGITLGYTGIRFGEFVGLETQFIRPGSLRVEWQLYELGSGELLRCPPKDESRRTIDLPPWHSDLLTGHIARAQPRPCQCHGHRYVFNGHRPANGASRQAGPKLADVASRAGVSIGTVSNVLNRPQTVPLTTCHRVEAAINDLGYIRGQQIGELAAHHRRSGFATWIFHPAVAGRYPRRGREPYPVPILADPWPGIPARGRGAQARADACWLPIEEDLTPHGGRHTHKTLMDELGTPAQLKDERLGHFDGSISARYSHVTPAMRQALMDGLTRLWNEALAERFTLSPRSPVAVLDRLLQAFARSRADGNP